jgi:DNA-binding NarL/FixJ family response regulator
VASRTYAGTSLCDHENVTSVLIVDDHPSFRASARALLESEGYEVVGEASDGKSAVEAAAVLHPDVVLLDVQLPDRTGFEVASQLTGNGAAINVVLVSSRDGSDYGTLVEESGASGFVPKAELSGARIAALLG